MHSYFLENNLLSYSIYQSTMKANMEKDKAQTCFQYGANIHTEQSQNVGGEVSVEFMGKHSFKMTDVIDDQKS